MTDMARFTALLDAFGISYTLDVPVKVCRITVEPQWEGVCLNLTEGLDYYIPVFVFDEYGKFRTAGVEV